MSFDATNHKTSKRKQYAICTRSHIYNRFFVSPVFMCALLCTCLMHQQPRKYKKVQQHFLCALDCSLHSVPWFTKLAPLQQHLTLPYCWALNGWTTDNYHQPIYRCSHAKHVKNYKLFHDISHINKRGPKRLTICVFTLIFCHKSAVRDDCERSRGKIVGIYIVFLTLKVPN